MRSREFTWTLHSCPMLVVLVHVVMPAGAGVRNPRTENPPLAASLRAGALAAEAAACARSRRRQSSEAMAQGGSTVENAASNPPHKHRITSGNLCSRIACWVWTPGSGPSDSETPRRRWPATARTQP